MDITSIITGCTQALVQFLRNDPHLLNSILSSIRGMADMIENAADADSIQEVSSATTALVTRNPNVMSVYTFTKRAMDIIMRKVGRNASEIYRICMSGQANVVFMEIERLEPAPLRSGNPSRRLMLPE